MRIKELQEVLQHRKNFAPRVCGNIKIPHDPVTLYDMSMSQNILRDCEEIKAKVRWGSSFLSRIEEKLPEAREKTKAVLIERGIKKPSKKQIDKKTSLWISEKDGQVVDIQPSNKRIEEEGINAYQYALIEPVLKVLKAGETGMCILPRKRKIEDGTTKVVPLLCIKTKGGLRYVQMVCTYSE